MAYLLHMAQHAATPVELRQLFLFGRLAASNMDQRLRNAQVRSLFEPSGDVSNYKIVFAQ